MLEKLLNLTEKQVELLKRSPLHPGVYAFEAYCIPPINDEQQELVDKGFLDELGFIEPAIYNISNSYFNAKITCIKVTIND